MDNATLEIQLKAKKQESTEIIGKPGKIEEKVLNDLVAARTYKKWFPKFLHEKAKIEL